MEFSRLAAVAKLGVLCVTKRVTVPVASEHEDRLPRGGTPVQQIAGGRPRLYCSNGCRQAAHRRRHAGDALLPADRLESVGQEHGTLPPPAPTEDQIACAILEARAIAGAFLRLGREACPQMRWRCEGVGKTLFEALACYFRELED